MDVDTWAKHAVREMLARIAVWVLLERMLVTHPERPRPGTLGESP